jgi:hypothetical protein
LGRIEALWEDCTCTWSKASSRGRIWGGARQRRREQWKVLGTEWRRVGDNMGVATFLEGAAQVWDREQAAAFLEGRAREHRRFWRRRARAQGVDFVQKRAAAALIGGSCEREREGWPAVGVLEKGARVCRPGEFGG